MYGYNQSGYGGYGSSYTNSAAAAAAASAYQGLGLSQAASQQSLQNSGFGTSATAPYGSYGNSVAASAAYGYGQQSTNALASAYAAQAAQQAAQVAAQAQVNRLTLDAYSAAAAAATPSQYASFGGAAAGYGSTHSQPAGASSGYGTYGRTNASASNAASTAHAAKQLAAATAAHAHKASSLSSTNYPGFDATVYAAASSYLQSKATGNTAGWMNKKAGAPGRDGHGGRGGSSGGGGGWNGAKKYGGSSSGGGNSNFNKGPSQQFYCETCKISCAGQLTYKEHLEGQKHKKKEALAKGENQSIPKSKVSFRCDLCNTTCTGQDTYAAHIRGSKHQKTLALCKSLGKPIPANECTIIPPAELGGNVHSGGTPIPLVGGPTKRVVGIPTVNFVAGNKLSSTGGGASDMKKHQVLSALGSAGKDAVVEQLVKNQPQEIQALIAAEQNVEIVGADYVEAERDANGKLLQYVCKLCNCKFNDPNAKDIHLKGRRHRLQYKVKVDPSLEVDVRGNQGGRGGQRGGRFGGAMGIGGPVGGPIMGVMRAGMPPVAIRPSWMMNGSPRNWFAPVEGRRFESTDDRHIQTKHSLIYTDDEQLEDIEKLVVSVEKALKKVSDHYQSDGSIDKKPIITKVEQPAAKEGETESQAEEANRLLKGVMRVGLLNKSLLLKHDTQVELVVLCSKIPTKSLLAEVAQLLPGFYESPDNLPLLVESDEKGAALNLCPTGGKMTCRILFTSTLVREGEGLVAPAADSLDKEACLMALALLRRSKWFQARCAYLQCSHVTLRILRDLRERIDSWKPLTGWMCELLVEKVLSSCNGPLSIGSAFRRVLEAIASGILTNVGPGLLDPCEKSSIDVFSSLSPQQRESLTSSAQHALRLVAFNQLYKVLGIDRLPDVRPPLVDRKRPSEAISSNEDDVKKDKKEDEEMTSSEKKDSLVVKMEV